MLARGSQSSIPIHDIKQDLLVAWYHGFVGDRALSPGSCSSAIGPRSGPWSFEQPHSSDSLGCFLGKGLQEFAANRAIPWRKPLVDEGEAIEPSPVTIPLSSQNPSRDNFVHFVLSI